jgi:lipopolysaccharide transport system permease protein
MRASIWYRNNRNLENYRDLLLILIQKDLKVRYKGKLLGYLWSVASPLSFAFVYFIAFSIIMKVEVENYPLILISGLFPWQWFSNSIGSSPRMFLGSASLIKKLNFPRTIIPLANIFNHTIHFILSLPVIIFFLLLYRQTPTFSWLYAIPLLLTIQLIMVYGIGLLLSSINLFLRDVERLMDIVMRFTFYFTPILYPVDLIPERYQDFVLFNPAATLIISWRELFLYGEVNLPYIAISLGYSIGFLGLGYLVYHKLSWRFAEVV